MKWLYEKSNDNNNRFVLGTVGKNPLVCFGINPSTAEPYNLDNTIKSVDRIRLSNGFDSWIMLNIYAQRATNPKDMHKIKDDILHKENLIHIERILKKHQPTIWGAWGTLITKRDYLKPCLLEIVDISNKYNCKWVSCGKKSNDGHPHHPLYLKKTEKFEEFDIVKYI